MIDLRRRGLPEAIEVDGAPVRVLTDFRAWIEFERCLREEKAFSACVFPGGRAPEGAAWVGPALDFLRSPNATPTDDGGGADGPRAMDYVLDGEYIVAGFQQAYGIDLTDPALEMHWHRFKALVQALPESTLMAQIVGWRTSKAPSRRADPEREAARARRRWALPEPGAEREERAVVEMQRRLFGGIEPAPFRARRG